LTLTAGGKVADETSSKDSATQGLTTRAFIFLPSHVGPMDRATSLPGYLVGWPSALWGLLRLLQASLGSRGRGFVNLGNGMGGWSIARSVIGQRWGKPASPVALDLTPLHAGSAGPGIEIAESSHDSGCFDAANLMGPDNIEPGELWTVFPLLFLVSTAQAAPGGGKYILRVMPGAPLDSAFAKPGMS
jgi:hypothetical protein